MLDLFLFILIIFLFLCAVAASVYFLFETWKGRILFIISMFCTVIIVAFVTEYIICNVLFVE